MNVIVNKNKINSAEEAKQSAERMIQAQVAENEKRKFEFEQHMNILAEAGNDMSSFEELSAILALPEEHFNILAPVFLEHFEKGMKNINDQMIMIQSMNMAGMRAEDVREQHKQLCEEIDAQMSADLSRAKRDFLKQVLGISYNALAEAEGISKRFITIPIEYCRPDAKMPTYAHLTDAGMDIYLTEDVTIRPGETVLIPTGIKVALPMGYELQVRPKSGRSLKSKLRIANTPGTIDAGYRDEIGIICDNIDPVIRSADIDDEGRLYNVLWGNNIMLSKGEKIAQLVLSEVPKAVFYEVENVSSIENDGRNGGFGSTGDK